MLAQIIARLERGDGSPRVAVFTHRSVIEAGADDVFRWHERPDALLELSPHRRWARIENRTGGLCDGGRVTFSIGAGPLRIFWEARHYGYIPGRQFCDEQVRGPFKIWRHTHRFEAIGPKQTLYEDRVEFAMPGGRLAHQMLAPPVKRLLASLFEWRHSIVRSRFQAHEPST
jgi:uncharacterized protein